MNGSLDESTRNPKLRVRMKEGLGGQSVNTPPCTHSPECNGPKTTGVDVGPAGDVVGVDFVGDDKAWDLTINRDNRG